MKTKPKSLPLDPPATEAELDRASQIWTAAQDVMVARGFARHLWGCGTAAQHEFTVLMLREATSGLEAQIAAFKKANGEMANALRAHNEAGKLGTGFNR